MTETYSVATNFGGITPSAGQLEVLVEADAGITTALNSVTVFGDDVDFNFVATISGAEKTALDALVAGYTFAINPNIVFGNSVGLDGTTMTIISNQTTDRTMTVPDFDDTFVAVAASQTLTNKTLTTPRITGSILDGNGNDMIDFTATTSAVNHFTVTNATTGVNPIIGAAGPDANVGLNLLTKGTGVFRFDAEDAVASAQLRLGDFTGTEYIGITVPATVASSRTHTLPDTANDTFAMLAAAQTLTNKTMTAAGNTFSGFQHGVEVDEPSSGVHGVTGSIVGTTDTQTLTGKTMTAAGNTFSGFQHGVEVDEPSSGVHGVTGSIVGTTDTQTLTGKTMTAAGNTFSGFQHGVEVDQPSSGVHGVTGSIVGTSDTQTLTNKTIDSTTNTVTSDRLRTATGTVDVSAATAPQFGQYLTATDGTTGEWQWSDFSLHVRAATVAPGTLATDFENGDVIDGYTLQTGNRILIKDQTNGIENGVYIVNASGAPTRAGDFPVGASVDGRFLRCNEGDVNEGALFVVTNPDGSDVVGTDALVFTSSISEFPMARIGNSTFFSVQHLQDIFHSSGYSSGGVISEATSNSFNVSAGTGFIRRTDNELDEILFFDFPALNGTTMTEGTVRFIGVEYNSGSPQVSVRTSANWNFNTDFPLGNVTYQSSKLHIYNNPHAVGDHANYMIQRLATTQRFSKNSVAGGLILGETGTRNITLSAGSIWSKLREFSISSVDTSAADTVESYYRDGVGGFTRTAGITQWPNTQYDDGSGTLATMTAGYYAVLWFYIEVPADHITFMYGTNEYATEAEAESEGPPGTIPLVIEYQSALVAKIIFQNGGSTATQIVDLFTVKSLNLTSAGAHNNLSGLQGGAANQYYHLSLTDYNYIIGLNSNAVGETDTQTLTNKTLTSPRIGTSILDTNGNEILGVTATASAVNELTLANAATGFDPLISATGGDTNIGIALETKGAGAVSIGSASATDSGILEILDNTGGESVSLTVPAALGGTYTLTLPDGVGTSGQFLSTDGNNPAALVWASPAGGGDVTGPVSATDNAIVRFDGVSGTAIQNSGVILSDTNSFSGLANIGMSGDVLDANGNELINFTAVASAVNEISITNAATAGAPVVGVTGGDTNIDLSLQSKGTGSYNFLGTATTSATVRLFEDTDNGSNYVGIAVPASITANRTHTLPDVADDTIALLAATQTFTNKSLSDTTTEFVYVSDVNQKMKVDLAGASSPTTTTLTFEQTVDRTITFPDATTTLVGTDTIDTLTNKTLTNPTIDNATLSIDDTVSTFDLNLVSTSSPIMTLARTLTFDVKNADRTLALGGNLDTASSFTTSGNFATTLTSTGTTNVTLPTTGTLSTLTGVETLTNKTITATSNNVTANGLRSATTTVSVSAATAPTAGQVLTATSSTTANWQAVSVVVPSQSATATADTSTTSGTYVVINSMTITPGAGTYLALFSSSGNVSNNGSVGNYAIFVNGTIIQHSERNKNVTSNQSNNLDDALNTQTVATVTAGQAIDVRFTINTGTFTVHERSLILVKLS